MVELEKFVVEGSLMGRARSLEQQQQAPNLINVVSSDAIGTLPDFNAAEAIARLPAIALITDQGEGRFVSIRGAKPNYNGTLINGFTMPAGDRSERRVDLQTVSNALVERIEVTKAAMPDMPAEGIGGMTNLVLRNPVDLDGRTASISAAYGVNEYDGEDYRAEVHFADFIGATRDLAISISANYRKGTRDQYITEWGGWDQVPASGGGTVWAPSELEYYLGALERYNQGGSIGLGYRLNDTTKLQAQLYYSRFWAPEHQHQWSAEFSPSGPFTASGGLVSGDAAPQWAFQEWSLTNYGAQLTGETVIGSDIKVDGGLGVQRALEEYPFDMTFVSNGNSFTGLSLGLGGDYITFGSNNPSSPIFDFASHRIARWQSTIDRKDAEKERTAFFNVSKKFDLASDNSFELKGGFYSRFRNKDAETQSYRRDQAASSNLTYEGLTRGARVMNFNGTGSVMGDIVDPASAVGFLAQNSGAFPTTITNAGPGLGTGDYFAFEEVLAGYLMGTFEVGNLLLVGGARHEITDEKLTRMANDFSILTIRDDFSHTMPSLHAKYTFKPGLFARASWSNTVGRHDTGDLIYGGVNINRTTRTITVPNPALKSLESQNIDLSLEWYTGKLGWAMIGYFTKDIDNFPLSIRDQVQFEGQTYDRNSVQAGASAEISGWEAAFQRKLEFLPGPLSGLGIDLNYAAIDSEVSASIRSDRPPLDQQPETILNASLFYAYDRFYVRLAYSDTGVSIDGTGDAPDEDEYRDKYQRWDLTAHFNVSDKLQLFAEWRNITDEPEILYVGAPNRIIANSRYGYYTSFGARWHF